MESEQSFWDKIPFYPFIIGIIIFIGIGIFYLGFPPLPNLTDLNDIGRFLIDLGGLYSGGWDFLMKDSIFAWQDIGVGFLRMLFTAVLYRKILSVLQDKLVGYSFIFSTVGIILILVGYAYFPELITPFMPFFIILYLLLPFLVLAYLMYQKWQRGEPLMEGEKEKKKEKKSKERKDEKQEFIDRIKY